MDLAGYEWGEEMVSADQLWQMLDDELTRLKYRYIDIRRPEVLANLVLNVLLVQAMGYRGLALGTGIAANSSVASMSRRASSEISPTPAVKAASPCQPSTTAPQSIEMMSPSARR